MPAKREALDLRIEVADLYDSGRNRNGVLLGRPHFLRGRPTGGVGYQAGGSRRRN